DSGNLAASLMALAQGLLAIAETPQTRDQLLNGIVDAADLLAVAASSAPGAKVPARDGLARVNRLARGLVAEAKRELSRDGAHSLGPLAADLNAAVASVDNATTAEIDDLGFWAR